jgi:hypothetical protein
MSCTRLLRASPRYVVLAAVCVLLGAGTAFATRAHAGGQARLSRAANWMAAVALPVPSPGDVSYAVARVRIAPGSRLRIAPGSRLTSPTGLGALQKVFATRLGGVAVTARSASWRSLRATVRVYVVVSGVRGGSSSLRDVAFFILRKSTRHGPANAKVIFTIANAQAQVGSFWVHSIDRAGYTNVFAVRNILSTALSNWSRYVRALQLAHAIAAATHPLVHDSAPPASGSAAGAFATPASATGAVAPTASASAARTSGPWIGGQPASGRLLAMYRLIAGAIGDANSYAALKKDPVVADFIQSELGNSVLASRWRRVVAQVPLKVPDTYAAAAQEERRFTRVLAPKVTRSLVAFDAFANSSSQGLSDLFPPTHQAVLSVTKAGTGGGTVTETGGAPGGIMCGAVCSETFLVFGLKLATLHETPASGSTFSGWRGCGFVTSTGDCEVFVATSSNVTATFDAPTGPPPPPGTYTLSVAYQPEESGQSGAVTSSPAAINCPSGSCTASFSASAAVTLTATPAAGSYFDYWTGCDSQAGGTCYVTMNQARSVTAYFGYP